MLAENHTQVKIKLHIKYSTVPGEQIYVTGNIPELGNGDKAKALPMSFFNITEWFVEFETKSKKFEYSYIVKNIDNQIIREEWGAHFFHKHILSKELIVRDYWNIATLPKYNLGTKIFDEISANHEVVNLRVFKKNTHRFSIHFPLFSENQEMILVGSPLELGEWDPSKAIKMKSSGGNHWYIDVSMPTQKQDFEYKYAVFDKLKKEIIFFEKGENRKGHPVGEDQVQIYNDVAFNTPDLDNWRISGLSIPVFSLRTKKSCGVGEFSDLKPFAKWAKRAGFSIIQILPINDSTAKFNWEDCYPYSAISVYALHPMYLSLNELPFPLTKKEKTNVAENSKKLNEYKGIEYVLVNEFKRKFTRAYFERNWKKIDKNKSYNDFLDENREWLIPYALFCSLRDKYKTSNFNLWKENKDLTVRLLKEIEDKDNSLFYDVKYHSFIQWVLDIQLKDAVATMHEYGVGLKGDLPIGIYRHSADAWSQKELFNLNQQAGAPPDDFSKQGQNWEFPTYNWDKMKENNYRWWKSRFEFMSRYFDAFRIDHILGFFRIWQIPIDSVQGILGRFEPAIPITLKELRDKGISLSLERMTKPFITQEIIEEFFAEDTDFAKDEYFDIESDNIIYFKEKFNTQRKVKDTLKEVHKHYEILMNLLANVLFISEAENPENLHPRYGLQETKSFAWIDYPQKEILNQIYFDYFYQKQESFWKTKGMEKLPILKKATNMLTCGEDLGMVPKVVPEVMQELAILNLQIQRMPSDGKQLFSHPADAPYLCVVSPGTHDTSTLRQWWREDYSKTKYYYNYFMGHYGEPPRELSPELQEEILHQHLYSPAMLCIIPFQEFLGIDRDLRNPNEDAERINIPSVFPHKWNYRMHISIEDLEEQKEYTCKLKKLNHRCGRIKDID